MVCVVGLYSIAHDFNLGLWNIGGYNKNEGFILKILDAR
jgi:hypothetical protein